MRIVFLGTSHGVPEPNRKCSCALLEVGENRYLIDCGTEPVPEFKKRGIPLESLKAVFITHVHGDHTNGLIPLVDLITWHDKQASPKFLLPEIAMKDAISAWLTALHLTMRDDLEFSEYKEGLIYDDGIIKVSAVHTTHMPNAYCFMIEAEGKHLLFSGDMSSPQADFARFIVKEKFDLAVGECAHFEADSYADLLRSNPPKEFVINHYSGKRVESCWRLKNALKDEIPVIFATDNLEITL